MPQGNPRSVLTPGRRRRRFDLELLVGAALFWIIVLGVAALLAWFARSAAGAPLPHSTVAYWDRVAACETGGRWRGLGATYQGGLGIYAATWDWWAGELGLERRYPDAGDAPRLVQIRVADY